MAVIKKNTTMRIDGIHDGMTRISTPHNEFLVKDFGFPFYKLVLSDQPEEFENLSADDWTFCNVKTVETWDKDKEWKGESPCLTGVSSFNEGWGPWFLAPEDLEVYTREELEEETR